MSDTSQGPGWWQASDGKWYPPEQAPGYVPPAAAEPPSVFADETPATPDLPPPTIEQPPVAPDYPPPTIQQPAVGAPPPAAPGAAPPYAAPPPPAPAKSRTSMWVAIGGVALLVVAGIIAALALTGGDDDDESDGGLGTGDTTTIPIDASTTLAPTTIAPTTTGGGLTPTTEPGTAPTTTARTTTTAAPTTTQGPPPTGDGTSPDAPLPLESVVPITDWQATILAFNPDATAEVIDFSSAAPPPAGSVYALIRVRATYNGPEPEGNVFLELSAGLAGSDGVEYRDVDCSVIVPDDLFQLDPVPQGGSVEGNFCIIAPPSAITGGVLYLEHTFSFDGVRYYFATG